MKFYFVCWHDELDGELNPVINTYGDIALNEEEVEFVKLFKTHRGAKNYMEKLYDFERTDYQVEEIEV